LADLQERVNNTICDTSLTRYDYIGGITRKEKNPERITEESIINWGRRFFGRSLGINRIFIIQLETDKKLGISSRFAPFFYNSARNFKFEFLNGLSIGGKEETPVIG